MHNAPMDTATIRGRLDFLRQAEALKSVLRSGFTSRGRPESTAEHSWRLCLMALAFEDALAPLDMLRLLKLCVLHDLGEAIHGDVPAIAQSERPDKSAQERADLWAVTEPLDEPLRSELRSLWEEYENASSPEALAVKALDKLETILQHTQGQNPPDFDYRFNLDYGRRYTETAPLFAAIRQLLDADTLARAEGAGPGATEPPGPL